MSDDDNLLPADDRSNLADINWDDVHLPDDDLWLLLTGRSVPPQLEAGDKVSPKWVAWAKETIRDVSFVPARYERNAEGLGRDDALALYLCRLMRIVDVMAESAGSPGRPSVELENLLSSAAEAAWLEVDLRRLEGNWEGTDDILRHACEAGLVQSVKAEGGPALYSLTLLGRRTADGGSVRPPPFRWSVQRELDAVDADAAPPGSAEPQIPSTDGPPSAGYRSPRPCVDGPADAEAPGSDPAGHTSSGQDGTNAAPTPAAQADEDDEPDIEPLIGRTPVPDATDTRKVRWFGELLYLGKADGQVAKLFWLLVKRFGKSCRLDVIQREIDGFETSENVGSTAEEISKSKQRIRELISTLRSRLRENSLDECVVIHNENAKTNPAYTMSFRPGLQE